MLVRKEKRQTKKKRNEENHDTNLDLYQIMKKKQQQLPDTKKNHNTSPGEKIKKLK